MMGLREQIIWGAKVMTDARIKRTLSRLESYTPIEMSDVWLLRQLYYEPHDFIEGSTTDRLIAFLKDKRRELWQRQQPLPYKQQ